MPYANYNIQLIRQRELGIKLRTKRRDQWFADNGPCKSCGSKEDLQLDHVDPTCKVSHRIWSWSDSRRILELSKCQPLCGACHQIKTNKENRIEPPEGMAWCSGCQEFRSIKIFNKDKHHWNGLMKFCNDCRKTVGWGHKRAPVA